MGPVGAIIRKVIRLYIVYFGLLQEIINRANNGRGVFLLVSVIILSGIPIVGGAL